MEDMAGYRSSAIGIMLTKEDAMLCMKNVAILHAKFWGDRGGEIKAMFGFSNSEVQYRGAAHSKIAQQMRKQYFTSSEKIQNCIEKSMKSEWRTSVLMIFKNEVSLPEWFRGEPLEDGSYPVLDDPSVNEMLNVLAKRAPEFNRKCLKHWIKKPIQTLLHGDFHGANHMYGEGDMKGRIVAIDFQLVGTGIVVCEFMYLIMMSLSTHSLQDIIDIAKHYHETLTSHGVDDYTWLEFQKDIELGIIEFCVTVINMMPRMKPKKILEFAEGWGEKSEDAKAIFGNGMYSKMFLLATSIYLNDKEKFMT
jgi:hypothetical protein